MKNLIAPFFRIGCFLIVTLLAHADSFIWTVPETDTSYQFLTFFFGNVSSDLTCPLNGGLGCSSLMPMIFSLLNQGVLVIGIFILSYVLLFSTANTAQDGAFMGERNSSFWLPARLTVGVSFLVPGYSGYSTLQMFIMKVVLIGVAMANNIYGTLSAYVLTNNVTFGNEQVDPSDSATLISSLTTFAQDIFPLQACYAYYQRIAQLAQLEPSGNAAVGNYYIKPPTKDQVKEFTTLPTLTNRAYYDCYNYDGSTSPNLASHFFSYYYLTDDQINYLNSGTAVCQYNTQTYVTKPADGTTTQVNPDNGCNLCGYFQYTFNKDDPIQETTLVALRTLEINLFDAAIDLVDTYQSGVLPIPLSPLDNPQPGTSNKVLVNNVQQKIVNAISIASQQVMQGAQTTLTQQALRTQSTQTVPNDWMNFPLNFYTWLALGQNLSIDVPLSKPIVTKGTLDATSQSNGNIIYNYYYYFQRDIEALDFFNQSYINHALGNTTPFSLASPSSGSTSGPVDYMYSELKKMVTSGGEPLFTLSLYGLKLLKIAIDLILASMIIGLVVMGIAGVMASFQSGYAAALVTTGGAFVNTVMLAFTFLIPLGVALGIYLPLMPVMIFALGALGWFSQVIESMVAGPVIALGMMAPSQDSLGKAEPSIIMMFNVLLRPSLMVIGMVLGTKTFDIFAIYFSNIFLQSFSAVSKISDFGLWSGLVFIVFWFFYGLGIIIVAQKCYGMVHQLPDNVLSWIGDRTGQLAGQHSGQNLNEMREGLNKGTEVFKKETTNLSKGVSRMSEDVAGYFGKDKSE